VKVNGTAVGTLQGFTPTSNRLLDRVREIMNEEDDIVEIVPGRSEFTITIDRLETYDTPLLKALGQDPTDTIDLLQTPFEIVEQLVGPLGQTRVISYEKCWIQNLSKTIREGTITVSETVTIWPERIKILQA
jgi:allophanate hydrolase subunit 1